MFVVVPRYTRFSLDNAFQVVEYLIMVLAMLLAIHCVKYDVDKCITNTTVPGYVNLQHGPTPP